MLFPRIQGAQKQVPETNGAGAATAGPVSAEADDDWFADETRKVLWHEYMSSAQVVKALPPRRTVRDTTRALVWFLGRRSLRLPI